MSKSLRVPSRKRPAPPGGRALRWLTSELFPAANARANVSLASPLPGRGADPASVEAMDRGKCRPKIAPKPSASGHEASMSSTALDAITMYLAVGRFRLAVRC